MKDKEKIKKFCPIHSRLLTLCLDCLDEQKQKDRQKIFEDIEKDIRSATIIAQTKEETQYAYSIEWLLELKKKYLKGDD